MEESKTVQDLCLLKTGTTSSDSELIGIITVVSTEYNDQFERGTILLKDLSGDDYLPCIVDRYLPAITDTTICIREWNYIYDEASDCRHLEFELDSVYNFASELSVLRESFAFDNFSLSLYSKQKKMFYTSDSPMVSTGAVHVAGKVESISVLYLQTGKPATFFIQLTGEQDNNTVSVMFSDDELIKYYRYFRIGSFYTLTNLKIVTISNGHDKRVVFLFTSKTSSCNTITLSQYQNNLITHTATNTTSSTSTSTYPLRISKIVHKKLTYKGYITRIIDSLFGIYELDKKVIICLFHYLDYSPNKPYRIGTKIQINHFHIASIQPGKSYLLDNLWNSPCSFALVACMRSCVEILSFPKMNYDGIVEDDTLFNIKQKLYLDMLYHHTPFGQLIRQLEIYAVLILKFPNMARKSADRFIKMYKIMRDQVIATTKTARGYSSFVNDFFRHDKVCSAMGPDTKTNEEGVISIILDVYPPLDKVKSLLEQELKEHRVNLAGGNNSFEKNNVDVKVATYDQTSQSFCIVGIVDVLEDGRMYLMDETCRILLVTSADIQLGNIYVIRSAQMFQEDLSYMDQDTGEKNALSVMYLSCQEDDFVVTHISRQEISFQMGSTFSESKVGRFDITSNAQLLLNDQQYHVVYVLSSYPIQTHYGLDGISLESMLVVRLYNMDHFSGMGQVQMDGHKQSELKLTSRSHSLKFNKELQVHNWYVIQGLNKAGGGSLGISTSGHEFTLDSKLHTIYPIHLNQLQEKNVVMLNAVYNLQKPNEIDPTLAVHSVSKFTIQSNAPHKDFLLKGPYFYFKKPIQVRGVVISKRFSDGFETNGLMGRYAKQLFEQLGIGTGKPNRKLQIQLRQLDGLDAITIYADMRQIHYPLGLVCGATVIFTNLNRKTKKGQDFAYNGLADGCTTVQVETTIPSEDMQDLESDCVESRLLSSFNEDYFNNIEIEDRVFKMCCYVRSILSLKLKLECKDCGSVVRNNDCHNMCKNASRVLSASAFVQVSDGTTSANASVDGERLVYRLLQLTQKQADALSNVVSSYGEIDYSGWGKSRTSTLDDNEEGYDVFNKKQKEMMHGYTLDDLCSKAKEAGNMWFYGKIERPYIQKRRAFEDGMEEEEQVNIIKHYNLREITLSEKGSILKTLEHTKMKIKVVELDYADPRSIGYELMSNSLGHLLESIATPST